MVDKNFIGLSKPDITRFESYLPTAFSSELSLLQKVNKIIQDLNRSFDLTNEMVDYLNRFIETFDEKLYETLNKVFDKWIEDGFLSNLIDEKFINKMDKDVIFINIKDYGVNNGDYINVKMNELINLYEHKKLVIFCPDEKYLVNGSIKLKSNTKIVTNKATIIVDDSISENEISGVFECFGFKEECFYNIEKTEVGSNVINLKPFLPNTPNPKDNEYVYIYQEGTAENTKYYATFDKITGYMVEGNTLYTEKPLFNLYESKYNALIQKVVALENIVIDGFTFEFNCTKNISGVYAQFVDGIEIRNIKGSNFSGNLIRLNLTKNFTIDNIKGLTPTNVEPGRGYVCQINMACSNGFVNNVYGLKARHTVDVGGGSDTIEVTNSLGVRNTVSTFGLHGSHEKNVTFSKCKSVMCLGVGGFVVGNSSYDISDEIYLSNCTSYYDIIGFYLGICNNVVVSDCVAISSKQLSLLIVRCENIFINGFTSKNGVINIQRTKNVHLSNLSSYDNKTNINPVWVFNACDGVHFKACYIENKMRYGLELGTNKSQNESLGLGHLPIKNITFTDCVFSTDMEFAILINYHCSDVYINNSILNSNSGSVFVVEGANKIAINNNKLMGDVGVRAVKNVSVCNNIGIFKVNDADGVLSENPTNGIFISNNPQWI